MGRWQAYSARPRKPVHRRASDFGEAEFGSVAEENFSLYNTMFCPVCMAEYLEGTTQCEDCGVELVEEFDIPETQCQIEETMVRVGRICNMLHAQVLRNYLARHRIPCHLVRSPLSELLEADLLVFESDALRARKLIRQYVNTTEESIA